jgi:hypothetical protein
MEEVRRPKLLKLQKKMKMMGRRSMRRRRNRM